MTPPPPHILFHLHLITSLITGTRHLKYWDLSSLNPAASNAQLTGTKASQMLQVNPTSSPTVISLHMHVYTHS